MAAPVTAKNGEIQPRNQGPNKSEQLAKLIEKMTPELARALPKHLTADRMARMVLTAIRMTPQLAECTQASFLGCVLSCAMLGLEPNTPLGYAYLIPRKNKKRETLDCTLQLGYQGMIELGSRAGVTVYAHAVRLGDDFRHELGTDPKIIHVPSDAADRETKAITHSYAVAILPDNRRTFTVLSMPQIEERRRRSATPAEGPWVTDFEAMCLKTAVRAHFKWMPKSTERQHIIAQGVAIEESAEVGVPLLAAMDPAITEAMERNGVDLSEIGPTSEGADQQ